MRKRARKEERNRIEIRALNKNAEKGKNRWK